MRASASHFRDSDYRYPLCSHPDYWFYVGKGLTRQAIIGLLGVDVVAVLFGAAGEFLEQQHVASLKNRFQHVSHPTIVTQQIRQAVEECVERCYQAWGLTDECIHIHRFRLPALKIGIEDLPDNLQEYLAAPHDYRAEEKAECEEALDAWQSESLYVFWWEEDFYVDAEGDVASS